jgi:ribonuclease P protein component
MLQKNNRVHLKKQYDTIFKANKKIVSPYMVVYIRRNQLPDNRYGVIASKKVGKAHERNLAKRRVRHMVRETMPCVKTGWDMIIICRAGITAAGYDRLKKDFAAVLKRGSLYVEKNEHQPD